MAIQQPPLDELQYRRPEIIQWWTHDYRGGSGLDENLMHRYLGESPFFDHTSKNGLIIDQSRTNMAAFEMVNDRKRFEEQLARQRGAEFVVVDGPKDVQGGGAPGGASSGVWVIRKQDREKRRLANGRVEDELTTLGTYYVVGENMYQAPSVGDVVGNRLTSVATSLSKFFDAAKELPTFDPARGYTYLPQPTKSAATAISTNASPAGSREGSIAPGIDSQSLRSASLAPPDSQAGTTSTSQNSAATQDARLMATSFRMALEFSDEYTDDNPIIGEPGNFSFTSSINAVKKRKADEEAATLAAKVKEQERAASKAENPAKVEKVEKPASPPAVMTEAKAVVKADKERRGSKIGEKARRKKSRANIGVSPTTPVSANSQLPASGGTT